MTTLTLVLIYLKLIVPCLTLYDIFKREGYIEGGGGIDSSPPSPPTLPKIEKKRKTWWVSSFQVPIE